MTRTHRTLTAALATLALAACATTPGSSPLAGEWRVTQIGEYGAIDNSRATLMFERDGSLTGNASCNRLTTTYTLDGQRIAVRPVALTRMACRPPEMRQEAMLVDILEQVTAYELDATGALVLRTPAGERIVAQR